LGDFFHKLIWSPCGRNTDKWSSVGLQEIRLAGGSTQHLKKILMLLIKQDAQEATVAQFAGNVFVRDNAGMLQTWLGSTRGQGDQMCL
jgi:hypothetical protein